LEEIQVTSTRASRLINDEPTRIEAITFEEIDEKSSMDPSNISMLLSESTGIQVQQTSAASATNTFRIQGLDGRYTQLLRDGFPLYSGFSGSFSINQIPPLDLSQIEIIKGSSSTLYGGGAIAGLINLISKKPKEKRELSFLINGTTAKGLDLSGYLSQKYEAIGYTIFASRNTQKAYDNNGDNFTDLPEIERYSINPKLFFYFDENNSLQIGGTFVNENRIGGSLLSIEAKTDTISTYTEQNKSKRYSTLVEYDYKIDKDKILRLKNSIGFFNRKTTLLNYDFEGKQLSSFSEVNYSTKDETQDWIFGLNLLTDRFTDLSPIEAKRNYTDMTFGGFVQNTFTVSPNLILESGLRGDYNQDYGWFVLPRVSLLVKWDSEFTSRIGSGFGYRVPNMFTEDAEEIAFKNILPIDKNFLNGEKSYGFNFDLNYKIILFDLMTFSLNQLFFYTRITNPVTLIPSSSAVNYYEYTQLDGYYDSRGAETNIKITYDDFKLFLGYTYLDAREHIQQIEKEFPLTPKHKLGLVLIYEVEQNIRVGLEAYYTGNQFLSTGKKVTDYWITGIMIEKMFDQFNLFLNFENFLDTRQSKFGAMYKGSPYNPIFEEIYAPTDGRIINAGIKLKIN